MRPDATSPSTSVLDPASPTQVPISEIDSRFLVLFEENRHRVYSTALRLTGRRPEAEDLAAETFLRAYRSLSGFDHERLGALQAPAWLSTILVNEWRNQRRTASRRPATVPPAESGGDDPRDPLPGVEEQVEGRADAHLLASMLLELPERQRIAVVLRYIVDLPIAEIADAMGCPTGTVKSHISRGLDRLRPVTAQTHGTQGAHKGGVR